jgi:transposase
VITPKLQAKVLEATRRKPVDGSTHWSCRKLAEHLRISKDAVHRIWRTAGIRPHRLERYMASDDPDFEKKAAAIIGLYLNPPTHAAVFCVDEKSAIQALDRLDPVLPLSPGRAERHGFEYFRHGTLSLYAALDVKTGKVHGKTAERHTSEEFVAFLDEVVALCAPHQEIHVIADNLSAHKTAKVAAFLQAHPRVQLHFTPTYSSWLNQVESGLLVSNERSSLAEYSRPSKISPASSCATFALTPKLRDPFGGSTPTSSTVSPMLSKSMRQATSYNISQQKRKRIEECFGWLKAIALLRKLRHRGIFKSGGSSPSRPPPITWCACGNCWPR